VQTKNGNTVIRRKEERPSRDAELARAALALLDAMDRAGGWPGTTPEAVRQARRALLDALSGGGYR
jgi:hypothetical protein